MVQKGSHGWCYTKGEIEMFRILNHTVILDVKTRWNSMYLMVERFAEIYPGLSSACRDPRIKDRVDKEKVEKVTDADLKKGEEFVETMRVLYTSTLAISTDKLPTVGQVLPTWRKLETCFMVKDDDSDFTKLIKTTVWRDMQKRYQTPEVVDFLEEASALDPRFKHKVKNSEVWERLESKVANMIQIATVPANATKIEPDLPSASAGTTDTSEPISSLSLDLQPHNEDCKDVKPFQKRKKTAIEELFTDDEDIKITQIEAPPTPQMQAHSQMQKYQNMPEIRIHENPLEFYKTNCEYFPMIASLASKYFSVSGSSVPSERVFSLAGNTISQERVRIDPDKADMLIFLHKNAD